MQRALMQFRNPANHALVRKALRIAGREDLIGRGRECLVPPEREAPRACHDGGRGDRNSRAEHRDNPAHDRKAIRHPDKQPRRHGDDAPGQGRERSRGRR